MKNQILVKSKMSGLEVRVSGRKSKGWEFFSGTVVHQGMGHHQVGKHRTDWIRASFERIENKACNNLPV